MQRLIAAAALMSLSSLAVAAPSIDCSGLSAPQVVQSATAVAPVAGELGTPEQPLGVAGGVLDQPATDALSAEQVLYRQQLERCAQVATATAPAAPVAVPGADAMPAATQAMVASTMPAATPAPEVIDAATYKPRTEFDNTPWRFNMNQNGERMTAEAFAAWMEAKGVRVAKGRAPAAAPVDDAAAPVDGETAVQAPEGDARAPQEQGGDEVTAARRQPVRHGRAGKMETAAISRPFLFDGWAPRGGLSPSIRPVRDRCG